MKSLLVILTLAFSAQAFASECSLPNKKDFIKADKVLCDDTTGQVLIEGIKVTKFGEEKSVLANGTNASTHRISANNVCEAFGLKKADAIDVKLIYSYFNTGISIDYDYDRRTNTTKTLLTERKQSRHRGPIKSVICNK